MGELGAVEVPPVVKQAGENFFDWFSGGPARRWVTQKTVEISEDVKREIDVAQKNLGHALDKYDPRIVAMKMLVDPPSFQGLRWVGKVAAVAGAGLFGYAIFATLKKNGKRR